MFDPEDAKPTEEATDKCAKKIRLWLYLINSRNSHTGQDTHSDTKQVRFGWATLVVNESNVDNEDADN